MITRVGVSWTHVRMKQQEITQSGNKNKFRDTLNPCGASHTHNDIFTYIYICGRNFKTTFSKHMLQMKFMSSACEITLRWMPQKTFEVKWTLVQLMTASSHYLSQCWPIFMTHHMTSLGQSELIHWGIMTPSYSLTEVGQHQFSL